jgi:hypothetical protein
MDMSFSRRGGTWCIWVQSVGPHLYTLLNCCNLYLIWSVEYFTLFVDSTLKLYSHTFNTLVLNCLISVTGSYNFYTCHRNKHITICSLKMFFSDFSDTISYCQFYPLILIWAPCLYSYEYTRVATSV